MDNITRNELRKLCRICLKIQPHMRFLSSSELIDGKFCTLSQMLKSCTTIQVSVEDELPNMICQLCINRLYISWDFKIDCENSEAKLHQILNSQRNMKEMEENVNLATSTCEVAIIDDNVASQNTEKDIQFVQVISVKNLNNNFKVGDNKKKVIVENLDQILKETNVQLTSVNNNNNNVSENNANHDNILTNPQNNRRACVENENKQLDNTTRKIIFIDNSPVLLTYNNVNESSINDLQYFERIENISLNSSNEIFSGESYESKNNVRQEMLRVHLSTLRNLETIDLTVSDSEENRSIQKTNSEESNVENENAENVPSPENYTILKYKAPAKEIKESNRCRNCKEIFPTKIGLHLHMKTHEDPETHCCPICDKTFSLFSNFEMHLKTHIKTDSLKCPKCTKYFSSMDLLDEHKKIHDANHFDCELCCKQFTTQFGLKRHFQLTHSGINKYFCDVCMKGFTQKIMLKHHSKIHVKDNAFKCDVCEKNFSTIDEMTKHNITHRPVTMLKCDKCDETFKTNLLLKEHQMEKHSIELLCELCSKKFDNRTDLKQHKLEHKKIRSLTCKICEKLFSSALELKNHIKTHFSCDLCLELFDSLRLLNVHKKKHSPRKI